MDANTLFWSLIVSGGVLMLVWRYRQLARPVPARLVFSTGLTPENQPMDEKKSLSLADKRAVLFVDWKCPHEGPFTYRCQIFDAARRQVHESAASIAPTDGLFSTWTWYDFNAAEDRPGKWRFEIEVDGIPVVTTTIDVEA